MNELHIDPEKIREIGYRLVDIISDEFADPKRRPIIPLQQSPETMESLFGEPPPQHGSNLDELLEFLKSPILTNSANINHPGVLGYIISGVTPVAGLIEALTACLRFSPRTWKTQPASSQIELTVIQWLGKMLGFSECAAGYFLSGATWANLNALAVARVHKLGFNIRKVGLTAYSKLIAYISEEGHVCFDKSMELLGMGSQQLRKIPTDDRQRIRIDLLEQSIQRDIDSGYLPFCVIANAGAVKTGAIDPLEALAEIAEKYTIWLHIDGAYGAFARLVPSMRDKFSGIERANSIVVDCHKWLNTPYESSCLLVHHWDDLKHTFHLLPSYLKHTQHAHEHNHMNYGFELSRADRALKVWFSLKYYGVAKYVEMLSGHLELAQYFAELVSQDLDFELMHRPELSVCCFRYVPQHCRCAMERFVAYLDRLNEAIEVSLSERGDFLISGTELCGKRVLRICIVTDQITKDEIDHLFGVLKQVGEQLDREQRS
jgi:aromatic-L-amino-acid decarboxylase